MNSEKGLLNSCAREGYKAYMQMDGTLTFVGLELLINVMAGYSFLTSHLFIPSIHSLIKLDGDYFMVIFGYPNFVSLFYDLQKYKS